MEGQLGKVAVWEISGEGKAKLEASIPGVEGVKATIEVDIVAVIELAAAKTENKVDDALVAAVKKAFGR